MPCRNPIRILHLVFLAGLILWNPAVGMAAQEYEGVCSRVRMVLSQELTLERIGFLATLEVTNNETDASITDFSVELVFEATAADPDDDAPVASELFFVQPPTVSGISGIDGTGVIAPGATAKVEWFIIPKISAGGESPLGVPYSIGAKLAAAVYGEAIDSGDLVVAEDIITVRPEPQLDITYFQPRDVDGDNPFTPDVAEAPIPFTVGVLVQNAGYGTANDVQIASQQPKIVENLQNLVMTAQLLGARVDDQPTNQSSLTLNLGDIPPGNCRKGAWDMITSLSGEFIEFDASYTHASELGGRDTSIITNLDAHFIVHEVVNDQPGRDDLLDFLADTSDDESLAPDTLYESDCVSLPVNTVPSTNTAVSGYDGTTAAVEVTAAVGNWIYVQLDDPAQAKYRIGSVVRSDGKTLDPNNYWTNIRYANPTNEKLTYLNLFDFVAPGTYTYAVTYEDPEADVSPPITTLRFAGEVEEVAGDFHLTPETQVYFTSEDESPVAIYYQLSTEPGFVPAVPFRLEDAGTYTIEYYAEDAANNQENHQAATIVVSDSSPVLDNFGLSAGEIFFTGDSVSVRSDTAELQFEAAASAITQGARVEVYRGVYAHPQLDGIPASPTQSDSATILVSGARADYYRYRLDNEAAWSEEAAVAQPLQLTGLAGAVSLQILARSQHGEYRADAAAVVASWTVGPNAPAHSISGPKTPTLLTSASISVTGAADYCYRVDQSYYQPGPEGGIPIELSGLSEGDHSLEVIARADDATPCAGNIPGQSVQWRVDPDYGSELPESEKILEESYSNTNGGVIPFAWNGLDGNELPVTPGWYTVKLTLRDSLGRASHAVDILHVGSLLAQASVVAGPSGAAQQNASAALSWVVWQDQRDGDWDIYGLDLEASGSAPEELRSSDRNQERPRTDGEYVVWEERRPDGGWDVWGRKLGSADDQPFQVTDSADFDERRPSIDFPWVVYQQKSASNPDDAWQLAAVNLSAETPTAVLIDPTSNPASDQADAAISGNTVVWRDTRHGDAGEIYLADLATGESRRVTDAAGSAQRDPSIDGAWVVWSDDRNDLQLDLYGVNLKRGVVLRLTDTPGNESEPRVNGDWVIYTDDSRGAGNYDLELLSLDSLASVQLTNDESVKRYPNLANGRLLWVDGRSGDDRVMIADMPDLMPVFHNTTTIVVTEDLVASQQNAQNLLELWNEAVGVTQISRYTSLVPTPVTETTHWDAGAPAGDDFELVAGDFLWVGFDSEKILDLGQTPCGPVALPDGATALAYTCFPDDYSAYEVIRELGIENVNSIRALDSGTGRWAVASVVDGSLVGEDFPIPRIAVLMIDLSDARDPWNPGGTAQ